jgi:zinc transporter ZupT
MKTIFLKLIGMQIALAQQTAHTPPKSLPQIYDSLISYAVGFSYIIAAGMIIFGGYQILFAGANEENFKNGKKTITYAVIGIIVIFLAQSIIAIVRNNILGAP